MLTRSSEEAVILLSGTFRPRTKLIQSPSAKTATIVISNYCMKLSENNQGRALCYPPKPNDEADNINRGLDNSRYRAKTEFNNSFIMQSGKSRGF